MNKALALVTNFLNMYFNIIPPTSMYANWSLTFRTSDKILYAFLVSHACYMPRPFHRPNHITESSLSNFLLSPVISSLLVQIFSSAQNLTTVQNRWYTFQNGSGAHPASYPIGIRGSFPGLKRPGREADHSPPSSAKVKNAWSYTSIPPIRLHGVVLS
jgi:hypothetical protein